MPDRADLPYRQPPRDILERIRQSMLTPAKKRLSEWAGDGEDSARHEPLEELIEKEKKESLARFFAPLSPKVPSEAIEAMKNPENCFDQYVVVGQIGTGGMSEVLKAWDREMNRWVAVKSLQQETASAAQRFGNEARLAGSLSHPNIVSVYGLARREGQPCFVMQYVEGCFAGENPVSIEEAVRIVMQAAIAVHFAHKRGIIHRDLKPGNVLIDRAGRVFVTDFGLARQIDKSEGMTVPGTIMGTPAYMPPEQAGGDVKRITLSSDVFSLGATLYHLCTGQPPYVADSTGTVLLLAVKGEFPAPRSIKHDLPRDLETVIYQAMAYRPEDRYSSAELFARDLNRWLKKEPILAKRIMKRLPWVVSGIVALVCVVAVLIGLRLFGSDPPGEVEGKSGKTEPSVKAIEIRHSESAGALDAQMRRLDQLYYWPVAPETKIADALLSKIEEFLSANSKLISGTSLPHAFRGWALCNLGRVQEGEAELARAVAAGGLEKGDPYGILYQSRWLARKAYGRLRPELFNNPSIPSKAISDVAQWSGWKNGSTDQKVSLGIAALARRKLRYAAPILESWPLPWTVEGLLFASIVWFQAGEMEQARRCVLRAAMLREEWLPLLAWSAGTFFGRIESPEEADFPSMDKRLRAAQDACTAVLRKNPRDLDMRLRRGLIHAARGEIERARGGNGTSKLKAALEDYRSVLARRPNDATLLYGRAAICRSLAQQKQKSEMETYLRRAVSDYTRILKRHPKSTQALNLRALSYRRLGKLPEALKDYTASIQIQPQRWISHAGKGDVLKRMKRRRAALAAYQNALARMKNAGSKKRARLERAIQQLREKKRKP